VKVANGRGHRPVEARICTPASHSMALLPLAALVCLLASGCGLVNWVKNGFKVGPNYVEPEVAAAAQWIDFKDPRVKSEEVDLSRWWGVFKDPVLDSLMKRMSEQNLTLRATAERIAGSQARRKVAVGFLLPQSQEAFGSFSYNSLSSKTANRSFDDSFTNWNAGFSAAWELDFWGRFRRGIESADAELEAAIAGYDDALVILYAEVATNYVLYRVFQERLALTRANVEVQRRSYELARDKNTAGAVTERDVQEARQILEQTRARIPELEIGLRQTNNALCLLLGLPPQDLSEILGAEGKIPVVAPEISVGIPADLIRRRPDVRRAERLAAAQSALIGIAESDLYPRFSILGTIGFQAENFANLFNSDALTGSIGPSIQWNILHYGRLLNNIRAQEAGFRDLALVYQEAVLRAGKEAEDAIVAFLKAHEKAAFLAESARAAERTVEITNEQYEQGEVDFTPLFIFLAAEADQEDQLAAARGEIALNLIALYRSLGGGWRVRSAGSAEGETRP